MKAAKPSGKRQSRAIVIPVEAHAVFNPTVPSDNAMKKNISAKFLIRTGVKLSFDNMKELK